METVLQILTYGIVTGALYGLVAIGLALLMGVMRFLNVAHGTFIILGGYTSYWLFELWHLDPFVSVPIVMAVMFLSGLILYKVFLTSLSKLPEGLKINNSMLITFGLIWVLDNSATLLWTSDVRSITTSYTGEAIQLLGIRMGYTGFGGALLAVVLICLLHLLLKKTYFGLSVRAATQDADAAGLSGINVQKTFLISCGLGIALAGAAGSVIVAVYSITPTGGLSWLLLSMVVLVLAGEGNINAILPAGLFLGTVEALSVFITGANYREIIGLAVFILVLMWRPKGLFAGNPEGA
jgi:branched-chain amino acid transport system permease protein